jgi:tetratricopeptide (TPR) repeat protein
LNNLALVHRDRGDYAAAESLLRRAVAIYDGPSTDRPRDHPRHAQALENLATVYRAQGKAAEADQALARAAIIWLPR